VTAKWHQAVVQQSLLATTSLGSSQTTRNEHFAFLWHLPLLRCSSSCLAGQNPFTTVCCREHVLSVTAFLAVLSASISSGLLVSSRAVDYFIVIPPHFLFVACQFSAVAAIFPFFPVSQSSCPSQLPWTPPSPLSRPFCCCRGITRSLTLPLQEITLIPAVLHTMAIGGR